jgi:hypothetical protein
MGDDARYRVECPRIIIRVSPSHGNIFHSWYLHPLSLDVVFRTDVSEAICLRREHWNRVILVGYTIVGAPSGSLTVDMAGGRLVSNSRRAKRALYDEISYGLPLSIRLLHLSQREMPNVSLPNRQSVPDP